MKEIVKDDSTRGESQFCLGKHKFALRDCAEKINNVLKAFVTLIFKEITQTTDLLSIWTTHCLAC